MWQLEGAGSIPVQQQSSYYIKADGSVRAMKDPALSAGDHAADAALSQLYCSPGSGVS